MKTSTRFIFAVAVLVLSLASLFVVLQGASDEPYFVFRQSDAIVQIGVAMILMLFWPLLGIAIIGGVIRKRVSVRWLPLLVWILICEFYLFQSPSGYVSDITRYVAQSH